MKQHITVEQLNELSDKGMERLREWWKPAGGDIAVNKQGQSLVYNFSISTIEQSKLPLLSIGQCIEFLEDHDIQYKITDHLLSILNNKYMKFEGRTLDTPLFNPLVDALWQACKEILEKESNNSPDGII